MASSPQPSTRFRKAARSEQERLGRERIRLSEELEAVKARLEDLDDRRDELDERIRALAALTGNDVAEIGAEPVPVSEALDAAPTLAERVLGGAAIREIAVQTLLAKARSDAPIHYRDWFALVQSEGWSVRGQRPDAVFLGQLVRSPLVRATTQSGFYELDLAARERLQEQSARLRARIAQTPDTGTDQSDALVADLKRIQRQLREVDEVLDGANPGGARRVAA